MLNKLTIYFWDTLRKLPGNTIFKMLSMGDCLFSRSEGMEVLPKIELCHHIYPGVCGWGREHNFQMV